MNYDNETPTNSNSNSINNTNNNPQKNMKHFKKSMIVEYERIENSGGLECGDSQSSASSSINTSSHLNNQTSSALSSSKNQPTSFSNISLFNNASKNSDNANSSYSHSSSNKLNREANNSKKEKSSKKRRHSSSSSGDSNSSSEELTEPYSSSSSSSSSSSTSEDEDSEASLSANDSFNEKSHKKSKKHSKKRRKSSDKSKKSSKSDKKNRKKAKKSKHKEKKRSNSDSKTNISNNNIKAESENNQETNEEIYCICRSADTKKFMIACDNCDEWYHGVCVGVNQSLSKKIKKFYCHLCRHANSSLKIKYKSKFHDLSKQLSRSNAFKYTGSDTSLQKFYKEIQSRLKKEEELLNTRANKSIASKSNKEISSSTSSSSKIKSSDSTKTMKKEPKPTLTNSNSSLANLNQAKCYGKSHVSGEDIENFVSALALMNDNASTLVTNTNSKQIRSTTKDQPQNSSSSTNHTSHMDHDYTTRANEPLKANLNSEMSNLSEDADTRSSFATRGTLDSESNMNDKENDDDLDEENDENSKSSSIYRNKSSPSKNKQPKAKSKKAQIKKKVTASSKKFVQPQTAQPKRRTQRNSSSMNINELEEKNRLSLGSKKKHAKEAVQCLGPECVNPAMADSKYCSNECGMRLAENRLSYFLKTRYDQYNETPCLADALNLNELDRINLDIEKMRQQLSELEAKHVDLDRLIERAKDAKINPNIEKDRDRSMESNESEIHCVSCGIICSEKHALKHMEKCFNKIESQAFFGSFYKTHIDFQSMFCEYYNPQTKMYCKRLKVICPEHEKEKKINDDEVCGYPLPNPHNMLEDSENEICLAAKRSCSLHFKWEKLRRAQIDLEKLRTWLKLEELYEQKRANETALNQRQGLLSILLHQSKINNSEGTSQATQITA